MASKVLDEVRTAIGNAKDVVTEKSKEVLDVGKDGTVDIQGIIKLAIKTPGVHIDREAFLKKEFFKNYPQEVIQDAIDHTPALAGIPADELDKIADEVIKFERNCVSGISAALGMPGGAAMVVTASADIIQYYGYTLRAVQKLLYLYGFPELESEGEEVSLDSETTNRIILCLGVMNGVAGANNAVKAVANALAKGVEKKLLAAALTKGAFYPMLKSTLKWFGVSLTKEVFAKTVKSAIPVVGGLVGGGITFLSFKPCCIRLQNVLRDTMLSNPEHVSSAAEETVLNDIIAGTVFDAEYEDIVEESSDNEDK